MRSRTEDRLLSQWVIEWVKWEWKDVASSGIQWTCRSQTGWIEIGLSELELIYSYIRWYANDILGNIGNILSISMMEPLCLHRFVGLWGQLPEIRFSDLRRGMTYAVMEWCKTQHDANVAAMVFSHFKSSLVCLIDFFIPQSLPLGVCCRIFQSMTDTT